MKKSHVINIVKKIIAIFIIVLILNNNYINYNVFAVGNSEIVADKMEQYVEEKILNKLTDEQKESRSWNWQDYEITNYPSGYDKKYKEYYDEYINAFNVELLNKSTEGYTKLTDAINSAKKEGRTKSFDLEQKEALDTGEQITDNNTKTDTGTDTGTNTEAQGTKPTSLDDIISNGKSFLQLGVTKNEINEDKLKTLSSFVSSVLLWIAIAVTLISAIVMGINFLTQSVEDKAKIKESMTPWVIGIIVSFSAYTIWQVTISIFSNL